MLDLTDSRLQLGFKSGSFKVLMSLYMWYADLVLWLLESIECVSILASFFPLTALKHILVVWQQQSWRSKFGAR